MVPPHVFEVSERFLRYAKFEAGEGSLDNSYFEEVALPEELFHSWVANRVASSSRLSQHRMRARAQLRRACPSGLRV